MTDHAAIRDMLNNNDRAVEKAMLALSQGSVKVESRYDQRGADYFARWILAGNRLSGSHLPKARTLALKYSEDLLAMVQRKEAAKHKPPTVRVVRDTLPAPISGATLTMNRKGAFTIRTFGPNHCGTLPVLDVRYVVEVECDAVVDGRGFLFDQLMVDSFFKGIKRSSLSCEKLAMFCAEGLVKAIRRENPGVNVRSVKMTLSPQPFAAGMTYAWKA
jgi:hypothetical protein